mmetsp:Transcript_51989/g.166484  ORF Transcript_51989/g.166484 Transcript_51989/m.166484 type:complete len:206 (+) Transcript_51989:1805-2422(+)
MRGNLWPRGAANITSSERASNSFPSVQAPCGIVQLVRSVRNSWRSSAPLPSRNALRACSAVVSNGMHSTAVIVSADVARTRQRRACAARASGASPAPTARPPRQPSLAVGRGSPNASARSACCHSARAANVWTMASAAASFALPLSMGKARRSGSSKATLPPWVLNHEHNACWQALLTPAFASCRPVWSSSAASGSAVGIADGQP